jgi:hypothetical protein
VFGVKKEIKVVVFENKSCEDDLPGKPPEFLSWWVEKFALIPEEHKDTGVVELYYHNSQLWVEVSYRRLETDEEEASRIKKEDDRRKFIENKELCQLEKLKAKYGV